MRNVVPIIALVAIVAIVGVFAATTFNNQTVGPNETVNLLNKSGDMISVTSLAEFKLIINEPNKYIKNIKINPPENNPKVISKSEMKTAYEDIFNKLGLGNVKISVSVSDLYKTENGVAFYVVEVTIDTDDYVDSLIFYQDAYTMPKLGDNGIEGPYAQYYINSPKNVDGQEAPKFSQEQILEKAKAEYASHKQNATGNEQYDIALSYVGKDPIYTVNINNNDTLEYDGNTGELLSSTLTDEAVDYESIAREVANERLKQENSNYSANLSLGSVSNTTDGDKILYTFEIVFKDDNGKQTVGHVKVDAKTKEVVDFVLNDPVIKEDAEEPTVNNTSVQEDSSSYSEHSYSSSRNHNKQQTYQDYPTEDDYYY